MMVHHKHRQTYVEAYGEGDCMCRCQNLAPLGGNIGVLRHCRRSQFHRLRPLDVLRHRRFRFGHRNYFVYLPLNPSTKYLYI